METELLTQAAARASEYRMYFLAISGFAIAGLAVTYGIQTQDTVAALGALLFIPNALVLFGVGLREHGWFDDRPASQSE
jgi:hypothetical protein